MLQDAKIISVSELIVQLNNIYFDFRGEAAARNRYGYDPSKDGDDIVGAFKNHWMYGEGENEDTLPDANRHEQEDGSIIAVAATGTLIYYA